MGYRLSKIYTRTGDDGTTGLADGSRVAKHALRVEAMGTVDELNSHLGILITQLAEDDPMRLPLEQVQHRLFDLGGEFAIPGSQVIAAAQIAALEEQLDQWNEDLPPLKNFILPGGSAAGAQCHLARSVCRRAERVVVALAEQEAINPQAGNTSIVCPTCCLSGSAPAGAALWRPGSTLATGTRPQ